MKSLRKSMRKWVSYMYGVRSASRTMEEKMNFVISRCYNINNQLKDPESIPTGSLYVDVILGLLSIAELKNVDLQLEIGERLHRLCETQKKDR